MDINYLLQREQIERVRAERTLLVSVTGAPAPVTVDGRAAPKIDDAPTVGVVTISPGFFDVVGVENDMRARFFGSGASTRNVTKRLVEAYPEFHSLELDVRDAGAVGRALDRLRPEAVIHTAYRPRSRARRGARTAHR